MAVDRSRGGVVRAEPSADGQGFDIWRIQSISRIADRRARRPLWQPRDLDLWSGCLWALTAWLPLDGQARFDEITWDALARPCEAGSELADVLIMSKRDTCSLVAAALKALDIEDTEGLEAARLVAVLVGLRAVLIDPVSPMEPHFARKVLRHHLSQVTPNPEQPAGQGDAGRDAGRQAG